MLPVCPTWGKRPFEMGGGTQEELGKSQQGVIGTQDQGQKGLPGAKGGGPDTSLDFTFSFLTHTLPVQDAGGATMSMWLLLPCARMGNAYITP